MEQTTTSPNKGTPDTENDTPPQSLPVKQFLSFTNGSSLKKHRHHMTPDAVVTYKECLKNHAASSGGHALDGCGEFMPYSLADLSEPTSLKCAACGCHRNFHRRDPDDSDSTATHFLEFQRHHPPLLRRTPSVSPPRLPPIVNHSYAPQILLALGTVGSDGDPPAQPVATPTTPTALKAENPIGRKRFRTKFSQEQKDKMFSFSEKVGWKIQKCDESLIKDFCNEIGVSKGVLKVWMHNNKNTFGKREILNNNAANPIESFQNVNGQNLKIIEDSHLHSKITATTTTTATTALHLRVSANGSSSST